MRSQRSRIYRRRAWAGAAEAGNFSASNLPASASRTLRSKRTLPVATVGSVEDGRLVLRLIEMSGRAPAINWRARLVPSRTSAKRLVIDPQAEGTFDGDAGHLDSFEAANKVLRQAAKNGTALTTSRAPSCPARAPRYPASRCGRRCAYFMPGTTPGGIPGTDGPCAPAFAPAGAAGGSSASSAGPLERPCAAVDTFIDLEETAAMPSTIAQTGFLAVLQRRIGLRGFRAEQHAAEHQRPCRRRA